MTGQQLVLNIAVNLGRLSRWAQEGKITRMHQFLADTENYLEQLEQTPTSGQFVTTLRLFKQQFSELKKNTNYNDEWAETALTWANILTHRAKLA